MRTQAWLMALLVLTGCTTSAGRFGDPKLQIVRQADEFTITLPSDWDEGYGWRLLRLPANVRLVGRRYLPPASKGGEGKRGHELWTFKAIEQGKFTLVWEYVLRRDSRAKPLRTYYRHVEVP